MSLDQPHPTSLDTHLSIIARAVEPFLAAAAASAASSTAIKITTQLGCSTATPDVGNNMDTWTPVRAKARGRRRGQLSVPPLVTSGPVAALAREIALVAAGLRATVLVDAFELGSDDGPAGWRTVATKLVNGLRTATGVDSLSVVILLRTKSTDAAANLEHPLATFVVRAPLSLARLLMEEAAALQAGRSCGPAGVRFVAVDGRLETPRVREWRRSVPYVQLY
ncbi:hypothetical protein HK405_000072 [Cladochytrium tenue]|nr:hypothetical protein HK405_000072 [Cladochytrium tenue]